MEYFFLVSFIHLLCCYCFSDFLGQFTCMLWYLAGLRVITLNCSAFVKCVGKNNVELILCCFNNFSFFVQYVICSAVNGIELSDVWRLLVMLCDIFISRLSNSPFDIIIIFQLKLSRLQCFFKNKLFKV